MMNTQVHRSRVDVYKQLHMRSFRFATGFILVIFCVGLTTTWARLELDPQVAFTGTVNGQARQGQIDSRCSFRDVADQSHAGEGADQR